MALLTASPRGRPARRVLLARHDVELVKFGEAPATPEARALVVGAMYAHARAATTGDGSLAAALDATRRVAEEPADDHLVPAPLPPSLSRLTQSPCLFASLRFFFLHCAFCS